MCIGRGPPRRSCHGRRRSLSRPLMCPRRAASMLNRPSLAPTSAGRFRGRDQIQRLPVQMLPFVRVARQNTATYDPGTRSSLTLCGRRQRIQLPAAGAEQPAHYKARLFGRSRGLAAVSLRRAALAPFQPPRNCHQAQERRREFPPGTRPPVHRLRFDTVPPAGKDLVQR